ncbi:MAG: D-alanine--D-alanine ligase [SAR324 cluster bacterium]|nr:D-alanine--D-alanine ligase [SAR324 cluster bacterium]
MNLGILCGGRSGEHEVSLQSAQSIFAAAERPRFSPMLVAIGKDGVWRMGSVEDLLLERDDPARIHLNPKAPAVLPIAEEGRCRLIDPATRERLWEVEVFFPIIHGTDGEDGALQGMLRMMDVPWVGAGVLGSAIGMDKDVMKRLLHYAGLPVARWVTVRGLEEGLRLYPELSQKWGLPLFVKPAGLGSSVGVNRVDNVEALRTALEEAFAYDHRALVEECVEGREIECSVLGNRLGEERPRASRPGEILPGHAFYSYEAKYLDPEGAKLIVPAEMDETREEQVREMAVQAFEVLECDGLARVDFFLKPDGALLVNEINTLPGFTKISMYPKLWEASGLPYPELITRLVDLGLERHRQGKALKRNYDFA